MDLTERQKLVFDIIEEIQKHHLEGLSPRTILQSILPSIVKGEQVFLSYRSKAYIVLRRLNCWNRMQEFFFTESTANFKVEWKTTNGEWLPRWYYMDYNQAAQCLRELTVQRTEWRINPPTNHAIINKLVEEDVHETK